VSKRGGSSKKRRTGDDDDDIDWNPHPDIDVDEEESSDDEEMDVSGYSESIKKNGTLTAMQLREALISMTRREHSLYPYSIPRYKKMLILDTFAQPLFTSINTST
jgi:hypothetical protein